MAQKYKERETGEVFEAIKWTGSNTQEVINFCKKALEGEGDVDIQGGTLHVHVNEREVVADEGDYIATGLDRLIQPIPPSFFDYEEA